jgi:transketolase
VSIDARFASGMALSGLRAYCQLSFFVFTDYAWRCDPPGRAGLPVIFVWTHDSIAMARTARTHQPVEQLASVPRDARHGAAPANADANEVVEAWRVVMTCVTSLPVWCCRAVALPTLTAAAMPVPGCRIAAL